ncbi:hypothetical protein RF55_11778 [Lasius niger]|uniref:Reverse transcriptase domain-containing protein n=1 Tax=Lasius niger TaxID=67767 RepID=A0A0J7KE05_LASNI|nr:hypothetical protein RF55_11778 [Lasius niger]
MFRQIRVHQADTDLQRILWRSDPAAEIQDFRLTTVTYGTAPAPYLAIRTLLQLAQDEGARFPHGADALRFNTYVDDILAGASSLEAALNVRRQLVELLSAGGFQLSKWAGTHAALCPDGDGLDRLFSGVGSVGTLGVLWSPTTDTLHLKAVPDLASLQTCTKRSVLSDVARFFDPVGWAASVLITAKVFLQDLWTAGLDWDEPLPQGLHVRWKQFTSTLPELGHLTIPRWLGVSGECFVELHGFSAASTRAYAAVVYLRGTWSDGTTVTRLLVAKTKVAGFRSTPGAVWRFTGRSALSPDRVGPQVSCGPLACMDGRQGRPGLDPQPPVAMEAVRGQPGRRHPGDAAGEALAFRPHEGQPGGCRDLRRHT